MVHLVANEDWRLARNYVTLGASPRPDGMLPMTVTGEIEYQAGYTIPDWALHWIHGVWNLFRHDGDRAATLRLLPVVERVLRWYEPYIDDHGTLSDVPEWNLIDWSSVFSSAPLFVDHRPVGPGPRRVRRDGRLAREHGIGGLGPRAAGSRPVTATRTSGTPRAEATSTTSSKANGSRRCPRPPAPSRSSPDWPRRIAGPASST